MDNNKKTKSRKSKFLNILLYLLFVIIIFFVIYRVYLGKSLSARLDAARAAGYPVTFDELNHWYMMPFDEENSANIILSARPFHVLPTNKKMIQLIVKEKLPSRTELMNEETRDFISEYLENNQKCLEILHQTVGLENGRYPVDFRLGQRIPLPPLAQIKDFIILLQFEAIFAAENNNPDIAMQSIKSMFGVTNSLNKEPISTSQSFKNSYQVKIVSVLENIINKISFSDEQLVELINELKKAEQYINGNVNAILGERILAMDLIMNPNSNYFDPPKDPLFYAFPPLLSLYKAIGLSYSDTLILLNISDKAIKASNLPAHKRIDAADALDSEYNSLPVKNVLLRRFIPSFARIIKLGLINIAEFRIAQVALAIERYRLANNKLPESLEEIVPDYLDSIPLDPYDGKEIRYKKQDKGFVVYSIGKDQIDDGGKEDPKDNRDSTYDITFIIEK